MNFARGLSSLKLSIQGKESDPDTALSVPVVAILDDLQLTNIDLESGK
jgi:hypothetical protein